MTTYRIEWQMGGEMILDYPDDGDDVADDAGASLRSADGTAQITFAKLA